MLEFERILLGRACLAAEGEVSCGSEADSDNITDYLGLIITMERDMAVAVLILCDQACDLLLVEAGIIQLTRKFRKYTVNNVIIRIRSGTMDCPAVAVICWSKVLD